MNGIAEKPHDTEEYIDSNGVRRVGHWSGCWCKKGFDVTYVEDHLQSERELAEFREPLPIVIGRLGEIYPADVAK